MLTDYDAAGAPSIRIHAERIDQIDHGPEVALYNVRFDYQSPNGQTWVMFGDVAHVEPGGKIVDVTGNVRLEGQSTEHAGTAVVRTDALTYDVPDAIASTEQRRAHRIRRTYADRPRPRRQFERAHRAPRIESQWPLPTLSVFALFALALQSGRSTAAAAPAKQQQIITLDAQSSELDLRTNNVVFHKVRITQGNMSVSADQGQATRQASGLDFDNSRVDVSRQCENHHGAGAAERR